MRIVGFWLVLTAVLLAGTFLSSCGGESESEPQEPEVVYVRQSVSPAMQRRLAWLCRTLNPPMTPPEMIRTEVETETGRVVCPPANRDTVPEPQLWVPNLKEKTHASP